MDKEVKDFIAKNNLFEEVGDIFDKYQDHHPFLGLFGKPYSTAKVKKIKSNTALTYPGSVVYEAYYTFDENGLRSTTNTTNSNVDVALVFGDSMAFGVGVNDNETFPSFISKHNTSTKVYNYGFYGHGPNHMLKTIQSEAFKTKFKNNKGKVFFLLRDDAVKIACCKIPWALNYPQFTLDKSKLTYIGNFNSSDHVIDPMYLPSEYTEADLDLTVEILYQAQRELYRISLDLELIPLILPISFSSLKLEKKLLNKKFKVFNFHFADMEYHTAGYSRFVDGNHTAKTHNALAFWTSRLLVFKEYWNLSNKLIHLSNEKLFEIFSFMMPSVNDFPEDDAGVIISMYGGDLERCKKLWYFKLDLLKRLEENKHIPDRFDRDWLLQDHLLHNHENIKITFSKQDLLDYEPFFKDKLELLDIFYYEYFETLKR